jgi:hypothetical protein
MESTINVIAVMVGVSGFVLGVWEYAKAQRWKKADLAAQKLDLLHTDPLLRLCCVLLDYSERRLPVPPGYAGIARDETFVHSTDRMMEGLKPETEKASFEWPLVVYRDAFDRIFCYLEEINHYLDTGLLVVGDVRPLRYWVEQAANPRFLEEKDVPARFVAEYGYKSVPMLARKLGVKWPEVSRDSARSVKVPAPAG